MESYCPLYRSWGHVGGRPGGGPLGSKVRVVERGEQLVQDQVGLPCPEGGWEDQGPAPYLP